MRFSGILLPCSYATPQSTATSWPRLIQLYSTNADDRVTVNLESVTLLSDLHQEQLSFNRFSSTPKCCRMRRKV